MGIDGIYLAQVIGNILFIVYLSGYTVKNCRIYFDRIVYKEMSIYGFPLFLSGVAAVLLNVIDRYSLSTWSVLKNVALYTLAFKIASVLKLVLVDSIKQSILPAFLKKMDSPDNKRFYSKILLYTSFVVMFAVVGLSMFSFEITKVISKSKQFWDAVAIIPVLGLSFFFVNMKEVVVYGLHIAKKSRVISMIVVAATILNLILNMILIPVWDIKGAAVATILSQVFYWFVCYYYAQKAFFIPYETRKLFVLFITGTLFTFSSLFLNGFHLGARLGVKSFLVIIFPFFLGLFGFYDKVEIQSIKGFVNKWSNLKNFRSNIKSLRNIGDDF
jgi:O-antigen/teichoic acid export membrane protein